MILVFDMDDTLYPEIMYVKSGINAVCKYLSDNFNLDQSLIKNEMNLYLDENGRELMFDSLLSKYNLKKKFIVKKCLSVYRNHYPKITMFEEAEVCLKNLNQFHKYLVTDGNVYVQRKKIDALGLKKYFIKTIPTYQYGIQYSKPSTFCFDLIRDREQVASNAELIYIGDNPNKDFVNLKKSGYKTIRVLTGGFKNIFLSKDFEAHITINNLKDLTPEFLKNINYENR
jgi:putative hydrolase of the HAD superfamily